MMKRLVAQLLTLVTPLCAAAPAVAWTHGSALAANAVTTIAATCDGATDNTTTIQNAINAAVTAGGGYLLLPAGTCESRQLTMYSKVHLFGQGVEATVLQLYPGANETLILGANFATLTGGNSAYGIGDWSIENISLDGNSANNSAGDGIQVYGYEYVLSNLFVRNFAGDGIYTEWGSTAGCPYINVSTPAPNCMESYWSNVKVHNNGSHGINFAGPHDSVLVGIETYHNSSDGFYHHGGTINVIGFHGFGDGTGGTGWEFNGQSPINGVNIITEGGATGNLWIAYQYTSINGGQSFNCNGDGIRIGTAGGGGGVGFTTISGGYNLNNCSINFLNDNGSNVIQVLSTGTTPFVGTPNYGNSYVCVLNYGYTTGSAPLCNAGPNVQVTSGSSYPTGISTNGSSDACFYNGGNCVFGTTAAGHFTTGAFAPPALTACGTTPSIVGSDFAGTVTMGTGTPTACTITFNSAFSSPPNCIVSWPTPLAVMSYAVSATAITLTQTATSGDKVVYQCVAQNGG